MGAMIAAAIADLVYRVAQIRGIANPVTFLFYQSIVFALTVWTIAVFTGQIQEINTLAWVFGLPAGLISYIGLLLFVMSLREGAASINAPIFRLSFVITAAGAVIVLGESVSLSKVIGALLAIVAVLFLADLKALNTANHARLRSMYLLLPGMILFGIAGVLNAEATNQGSKTIPPIM